MNGTAGRVSICHQDQWLRIRACKAIAIPHIRLTMKQIPGVRTHETLNNWLKAKICAKLLGESSAGISRHIMAQVAG